jgi:hypothetical protein
MPLPTSCTSRGRHKGRGGMGEAANSNHTERNLVDINVATVEELSTLVGVGRSRAEDGSIRFRSGGRSAVFSSGLDDESRYSPFTCRD